MDTGFYSGIELDIRTKVARDLGWEDPPPAMTLLGLPWGPLASWDAAGKCFITLAAVISLLAASCLYLLLRVGVKLFFLVAASVVRGHLNRALLAPPSNMSFVEMAAAAHFAATAFLEDSLFAWTTLAAVLLIPYETREYSPSIKGAVVRGILRASILSLGLMTKMNFLYFIVLIVPTLFAIRLRHAGLHGAFAALITLAGWSAPAAIYLIRHGRPAFDNTKASSFGWWRTSTTRPYCSLWAILFENRRAWCSPSC